MIIINFKGIEASLENEKWTCKDKQLKILLDLYTYDLLEGYSPFKDLSLAELVGKEHGAKIIKITNQPKYVKGRVY
ncbi:MAG: hypothetical protein IMZ60_01755 [Actinobacteria bacterium]|nr:hypothetical protein [Actinomycetota bacterium]